LQIAAGKATPAPPVGPALGQAQINIMEFCKQFNARTSSKELEGLIVPVVVTVYSDRTFTFITKTPPASILLKRAANIAKGSGTPNKEKVGKVTEKQVLDIAKQKMPDLNAASLDAAVKSVKGTARSMGLDVVADEQARRRREELLVAQAAPVRGVLIQEAVADGEKFLRHGPQVDNTTAHATPRRLLGPRKRARWETRSEKWDVNLGRISIRRAPLWKSAPTRSTTRFHCCKR